MQNVHPVLLVLLTFALAGCSSQQGAVRSTTTRRPAIISMGATPFRSYDEKFVGTIQKSWDHLLDAVPFSRDRTGEVVVTFKLKADGHVNDIAAKQNGGGAELSMLCQRAVLEPQPYDPWPLEMQRAIGKGYRQITLSFHFQ